MSQLIVAPCCCTHPHSQPPFNTEARAKAGFDESWYLPLVQ
jgi:uncharacterized ferritin-like protein (DUF455 family)